MFFEWGNEGKFWESCTSYAIIRFITVRVMRSLLYFQRVVHSYNGACALGRKQVRGHSRLAGRKLAIPLQAMVRLLLSA